MRSPHRQRTARLRREVLDRGNGAGQRDIALRPGQCDVLIRRQRAGHRQVARGRDAHALTRCHCAAEGHIASRIDGQARTRADVARNANVTHTARREHG